eukprot:TRINITY_DN6528_c0_g1_i1.p1 TRINITY_DN6528_c0_g1~~TRINITY_DN6528_c0_g1_i1.p1  ORF type:complete len:477 (+),score=136.82 TRINITY_DN6528_c0_g1_i1:46-1476(+)
MSTEHKRDAAVVNARASAGTINASQAEVTAFKQSVKNALDALFVSHDISAFITALTAAVPLPASNPSSVGPESKAPAPAQVVDPKLFLPPVYQFILVKIMITSSLDRPEIDDRKAALDAISLLAKDGVLSNGQISSVLLVLAARLDHLINDVPLAVDYLKEFVVFFELLGYVDPDTVEALYQQAQIYQDVERAKLIKKKINDLLREYFSSHDLSEFRRQLVETNAPEFDHEVIKKVISISCDMTERERELASQLISALSGNEIKAVEIRKGFQMLVLSADDLKADIPHIVHLLSCFVARAVADEVLPPAFLSQQDLGEHDTGALVIKQASGMLKTNPASSRLERVWGFGGEFDSIANLKDSITEILNEFFVSAEVTDATKSIAELNTPYFYHEVVRRGFSLVLDKESKQMALLVKLFVALHKQKIISSVQFQHGLERIQSSLPELCLDVPNAAKLFETLKAEIEQKGLLSEEKQAS